MASVSWCEQSRACGFNARKNRHSDMTRPLPECSAPLLPSPLALFPLDVWIQVAIPHMRSPYHSTTTSRTHLSTGIQLLFVLLLFSFQCLHLCLLSRKLFSVENQPRELCPGIVLQHTSRSAAAASSSRRSFNKSISCRMEKMVSRAYSHHRWRCFGIQYNRRTGHSPAMQLVSGLASSRRRCRMRISSRCTSQVCVRY